MAKGSGQGKVEDILNRLDDCAEAESDVSVAAAMDEIGNRSFGPLLLMPALIAITPIGGIPAVPTLFALTIAIFAVQVVLRRKHLWLPAVIRNRAVEDDSIRSATDKALPVARWLDRNTSERLAFATRPPMPRIAAALALCLCLIVPPLELVPFAALLPLAGIAALGLAITVRDGLLMALALLLGSAGLIGGLWLLISD